MTSSTTRNASDDTGDGRRETRGRRGRRRPRGVGAGPAVRARARRLAARAAAGAREGVALVAVGGLGRRECAPHGDLDLVLLHAGRPAWTSSAARLWYPIWDAGLRLDHSVRTLAEALVGGPRRRQGRPRPARRPARRRRPRRCRRRCTPPRPTSGGATRRPPAARAAGAHRRRAGGPRRAGLPARGRPQGGRAAACATWASCAASATPGSPTRSRPAVRAAHRGCWTSATRCTRRPAGGSTGCSPRTAPRSPRAARASHDRRRRCCAGSPSDARTIAYALRRRLAGRRPAALRPPPGRGRPAAAAGPVARDVVEQDGEVVLARAAIGPAPDPSLSLRVAAAAARDRLPIAPGHLRVAGRVLPAAARARGRRPPAPRCSRCSAPAPAWCPPGRPATGTAWSTAGCPSGPGVRSLPQHNPVHRFTLDRHLVADRARGEPATPATSTGPTCCCSARSCTTSARACTATTATVGAPIAAGDGRPDRPAADGRRR